MTIFDWTTLGILMCGAACFGFLLGTMCAMRGDQEGGR